MAFKDHFSGHASSYARYRPDYPAALFEYLATLTPRHEIALDCATGSGQAAVGLAKHFDCVIATDGSLAQLRSAQAHPHVAYLANLAEQPALRDASVDLAAAAQAAHWFDHERFHPQMRRVLRPDGVLALWTYGLAFVSWRLIERPALGLKRLVAPPSITALSARTTSTGREDGSRTQSPSAEVSSSDQA